MRGSTGHALNNSAAERLVLRNQLPTANDLTRVARGRAGAQPRHALHWAKPWTRGWLRRAGEALSAEGRRLALEPGGHGELGHRLLEDVGVELDTPQRAHDDSTCTRMVRAVPRVVNFNSTWGWDGGWGGGVLAKNKAVLTKCMCALLKKTVH